MSAFDGSPWVRRLARRKALAAPGISGIFTLAGINTNELPDGTVVWVSEVVSDYRFLRESTAAPDNFDVVAPAAGPGRWIREGSPDGGCCAPLSSVLYVDGGSSLKTRTGSECCPFATIQQAVDASVEGGAIVVAEGNYPEDVVVPKSLLITSPGIIWSVDRLKWNNQSGALFLENCSVTGDIIITGAGLVDGFFSLIGIGDVGGGIDATGHAGFLGLNFTNPYLPGTGLVNADVNAPTATLGAIDRNGFAGNITVNNLDRLVGLTLGGSVAVAAVPSSPNAGLFRCALTSGTLTGPDGAFPMDAASLHAILGNPGVAFAGGTEPVVALAGEDFLHFAATALAEPAGTDFLFPWNAAVPAGSLIEHQLLVPRPGTLRGLRIRQVAGGGAVPITYVLRVNGVDTALSVATASNLSGGSDLDLNHRVQVVSGDLVSIRATHGVLGPGVAPSLIKGAAIFD